MAEGKEIKFRFVVDEQSAQRVNKVLDEIIKKAQDLGKTLQNVGGGGGILGGGAVGGRAPSPQSTIARAGSTTQKVSFATLLGQNAEVFKKAANDGTQAMKAMSDALTRGITGQQREVYKLQQSLDALTGTYNRLGGAASGALGEKLQNKIIQVQGRVQAARGELQKLQSMQPPGPELMPEIPWPGREPKGKWAAFKETMTKQREVPGLKGMMGKGTMMGDILGGMGITPSMLGSLGLAAVGAWGAKNIYNQLSREHTFFNESEARRGRVLANQVNPILAGDYRNEVARQTIMADPELRKDYMTTGSGWQRFTASAGAFLKGDFTEALSGRAANNAVNLARQRFIENQRASDPFREAYLGQLQDYQSTLGQLRAVGGGVRRGESGFSALTRIKAAYPGFDIGEIAGAQQGIEATGTRAAGYQLRGAVLQAQAGGMRGAASYAGTMSQFGRGVDFLNAARVMGAETDPLIADRLAQFTAQQAAQQGTMGISGLGAMGMLSMDVGKGPTAALTAEQNVRGFGALQNLVSGNIDPYQQARNLQIAMSNAPDSGVYTQDYLANKLNLTQMADVMSGTGNLSPIAKSLGITKNMVGQQFSGVVESAMERIINDPMMANTSMAKTMSAIQESGMDPRSWFKAQKGKKGFKKEQAVSDFGAYLLMSGMAPDEASAMGEARDIFGMGRAAATKGKRRIGDVAGATPEMGLAIESLKTLGAQAKASATDIQQLGLAAKASTLQVMAMSEGGIRPSNSADDELLRQAAAEVARTGGGKKEVIDAYNRRKTQAQAKAIPTSTKVAATVAGAVLHTVLGF